MNLSGDQAISCSSCSTPYTTTITTTTPSPIIYPPNLNLQLSASTPCLSSTSVGYHNQSLIPPPIQSSLASNIQDGISQHQSNPTLSTNSNPRNNSDGHSWQIVRPNKRKTPSNETSMKIKMVKKANPAPHPVTISPSLYQPLAVDDDDDDEDEDEDMDVQTSQTNNSANTTQQPARPLPPPPPVFIHGVINYQEMKTNIGTVIRETEYTSRTLANNTVKINPKTSDAYRTLVRHLRTNNIIFHTYQIKQDRAYRVVIRHVHYSIPIEDIKADIENSGFKVRAIMNITHRTTKTPLNLFFVDLEPADNNKDIYNLKYILNMKVAIEPPRKSTNIVQCTRCQAYGHTKSYCTRPFSCVKCGRGHSSATCTKARELPAQCALCDGPHPANYKGCTVYKELQAMKQNNQEHRQQDQSNNRPSTNQAQNIQPNNISTGPNTTNNIHPNQTLSYSDILRQRNQHQSAAYQPNFHTNQTRSHAQTHSQDNQQHAHNEEHSLSSFLSEFKAMFSQLMSQNTAIMNMLQIIISNLVQKND